MTDDIEITKAIGTQPHDRPEISVARVVTKAVLPSITQGMILMTTEWKSISGVQSGG
jgi:hypothetical protein